MNDAPVAQQRQRQRHEDTPIDGTLIATDVESPTPDLSRFVAKATNGTVMSTPTARSPTRRTRTTTGPTASPSGPTTATVDSNTATVTITVNPVNDAPVARTAAPAADEDTPIAGTLVATDVDERDARPIRLVAPGDQRDRRGQRRDGDLHLHADPELQRHRQLHLHGQRRDRDLATPPPSR